jgi:hypothetical protein
MHSKKVSITIGLIILILDLLLMAVYLQRQGEHTFGFVKSLYEEIKVYRKGTTLSSHCRNSSDQDARFFAMRTPVFLRELWTVTMLTSIL